LLGRVEDALDRGFARAGLVLADDGWFVGSVHVATLTVGARACQRAHWALACDGKARKPILKRHPRPCLSRSAIRSSAKAKASGASPRAAAGRSSISR